MLFIKRAAAVLAGTSLLAAAVLVLPGAVDAAQKNGPTGANSTNVNRIRIRNSNSVTTRRNARVRNTVVQTGVTGSNVSKKNTAGGSITTGNVKGTVTVENTVNEDTLDACCGCGLPADTDVSDSQTNTSTGNSSTNVNRIKVTNHSSCTEVNNAHVNNYIDQYGRTGGNTSSGNTEAGDTTTGDVTFTSTVTNTVN